MDSFTMEVVKQEALGIVGRMWDIWDHQKSRGPENFAQRRKDREEKMVS